MQADQRRALPVEGGTEDALILATAGHIDTASGTVVTGTALRGRVRPGDALLVSAAGWPVHIRRLQAHGSRVATAEVGQLIPNAGMLPAAAARDASGAVMVDDALRSSVPGLLAAGAVRGGYGSRLAHALTDAERAVREATAALAGAAR